MPAPIRPRPTMPSCISTLQFVRRAARDEYSIIVPELVRSTSCGT